MGQKCPYLIKELKMKIVNLTPHDVVFVNEEDGKSETFKASGNVARVEQFLFNIPGSKYNLKSMVKGYVVDLPDEDKNTVYIVSTMVREELKDREDLWSPTSFIRDEEGNIVGCTAFIVN